MHVWILLAVAIFISSSQAAVSWRGIERKPERWWSELEARQICTNILSWQTAHGDWPKNTDTLSRPNSGGREQLKGTFDNSATTRELRFLAHYFSRTQDAAARGAFLKGYRHILDAQYANGGWPQFYPAPAGSYPRHVTFNDNTMVRLLEFLRESLEYEFLGAELRQRAQTAFEAGVQCILKCQIRVDGKLTVWCAQHDEETLRPAAARSYELPSLSGAESARLVKFLMSLQDPSPEVLSAVDSAMEWFEKAKLAGIKVVQEDDPRSPNGRNKIVVKDPFARPMWARFYEIETNRPMFVDRDGVRKYDISEIGFERRNGYAWLGYWPEELFKTYSGWRKNAVEKSR